MDAITTREVARRTGLTARALRFYEPRGLVRPKRTYAGARLYGAPELERLARVVALKRAGLTLAQIARVLGGRTPDLAALIDAQLATLTDLGARIGADLPMDPSGEKARAYITEWNALLAPFNKVADEGMKREAFEFWERMPEWGADVPTPFSPAVWAFVKQAMAA